MALRLSREEFRWWAERRNERLAGEPVAMPQERGGTRGSSTVYRRRSTEPFGSSPARLWATT